MATSLRDLRRKIKSINSTQKITSAMQLVAASKMQRAVKRATESRPYTDLASGIMAQVAPAVDPSTQPLFSCREPKRILTLLVTTNRGLAGSLNTQLIRHFFAWKNNQTKDGKEVKVVAVGAKGRNYILRFAREDLLAEFTAPDTVPNFSDITPIAQLLIDEFLAEKCDAVYLAYNQFVSTLRQESKIVSFLPFEPKNNAEPSSPQTKNMLFEPSREEILNALIPRALRVQLYQVLLETHASEQSARMLAMKNATDNAGDLLEDLTLTYNGVRQTAITSELLDIAAGAAALEN